MQVKYYDYVSSEKEIVVTDDFWKTTIKHPHFSRLKHIKQLGNSVEVFVNNNHTRYSHSLGTGFLVCALLDGKIEKSEKDKAIFAGLCHDIGHGPFSHSLEHITPLMILLLICLTSKTFSKREGLIVITTYSS